MGITRDRTKVITTQPYAVVTCSTGNQTFNSTGKVAISSCGLSGGLAGVVIDRLDVEMGCRWQTVEPFATIETTRGSTEADKKLTLGPIILQHGDSSGGGDMASLSTESVGAARIINTTAETTPMVHWSTAAITGISTNPGIVDLNKAKRYIRTVLFVGKNAGTTESSGYESAIVQQGVVLKDPDFIEINLNQTGAFSTSTSTST